MMIEVFKKKWGKDHRDSTKEYRTPKGDNGLYQKILKQTFHFTVLWIGAIIGGLPPRKQRRMEWTSKTGQAYSQKIHIQKVLQLGFWRKQGIPRHHLERLVAKWIKTLDKSRHLKRRGKKMGTLVLQNRRKEWRRCQAEEGLDLQSKNAVLQQQQHWRQMMFLQTPVNRV